MTRYGTNLYGEFLYGEDASSNLLWAVEVDWTGTGYTGSNEAIDGGLLDLIVRRGRKDYLVRSGKGFAHNQVGQATIVLDNTDGRYDPYNSSSPIYGYVEPGKDIRVKVRNGTSGTYYSVFTGVIDDIQPTDSNRKVIITALDGWRFLLDTDVEKAVQTNYRTDQAISDILDAVGWAWESSLAVGNHSVDYWWETGKSASQAINDLVDAEFGSCAILADGTFEFQNRDYSGSSAYAITQAEMLKDITSPQPWETVRNIVDIKVYPRVLQTNVDLYEMRDTPEIAASGSLTLFGDLTYDGRKVACNSNETIVIATDDSAYEVSGCTSPDFDGEYFDNGTTENGQTAYTNRSGGGYLWWNGAADWILSDTQGTAGNDYFKRTNADPVGTFTLQGNAEGSPELVDNPDVTFNTQADGGGSDIVSDLTVTVTLFGERAKFVFENANAAVGYITKFRLRGTAIDTPDSSVVRGDQSGTDKDRIFTLDVPWHDNITSANALASYMSYLISISKQFPILQIEQRPAYQFGVDLNDRIDVTIDKLNIDETYKVIYIEHRFLHDTGQGVLTTLYTEAAAATDRFLRFDYGQFDVHRFGLGDT